MVYESIALGTSVFPMLAVLALVRLTAARSTNACTKGLLAWTAITFATTAAVTFAATFITFLIQGRLGVDDSRFRR